jgi:hypothetical protein
MRKTAVCLFTGCKTQLTNKMGNGGLLILCQT